MKKTLFLTLISLTFCNILSAQDYSTGVGLRGGFSNGISVKHFIGNQVAIEAIVSTRWSGLNATGLYEMHKNAFEVSGLYWFYGAGAHVGIWNGKHVSWVDDDRSHIVIGIDGILGMEYQIQEIPFTIGLDYKPALNLIGYSGFWGDGGALTLRYVF